MDSASNRVRIVLALTSLLAGASSVASAGSNLPAAALSGVASGVCLFLAFPRRSRHATVIQLETELNRANAAFKQVVENLPVGLFMIKGGHFEFTNWAWDEQMMRMPGQAPGNAFVKALHPEDRERVLTSLKQFEEQEEPFRMQFRLVSEFGDRHHIESQGVPVYGSDGSFQHLLGFNIDATSATQSSEDLDTKNKALQQAFGELESNLEAMVGSLVKAIEAKDPYTAGHSERVMEYSVRIGEALGLSREDMRILRMGTLIHDIGKIGVPDDVLGKPDKLTPEEFEIIKRHPVTGYRMIRDIPFFKDCAPIVRWHHERLNGKGYPDGLAGEEIPLLVQISTIADMFDAMTSNRAYRRSLGAEAALAELRKDAERNVVNGELVELWARLLEEDGVIRPAQQEDLPKAA